MCPAAAGNKKGASPCRRAPFISSKQLTSISSCRMLATMVYYRSSLFTIIDLIV
nr:MAG TPA: hypothetical protein [Caudoviricetes sp.]